MCSTPCASMYRKPEIVRRCWIIVHDWTELVVLGSRIVALEDNFFSRMQHDFHGVIFVVWLRRLVAISANLALCYLAVVFFYQTFSRRYILLPSLQSSPSLFRGFAPSFSSLSIVVMCNCMHHALSSIFINSLDDVQFLQRTCYINGSK